MIVRQVHRLLAACHGGLALPRLHAQPSAQRLGMGRTPATSARPRQQRLQALRRDHAT